MIESGGDADLAALEVMRSDEDAAAGFREWLAAAQRAGQRVLREPDGTYVLWRRDDVLAAIRDGETFASRQGELMPGNPPFGPYRKIMVELLFTPGNSRDMLRPVRGIIERIVGAVAARRDSCDGAGVADVVWRAAFVTICGLPTDLAPDAVNVELVGAIRRAPQGGPDVISLLATEPLTDLEVLGVMGSVGRGVIFASLAIKAGLAVLARQPYFNGSYAKTQIGKAGSSRSCCGWMVGRRPSHESPVAALQSATRRSQPRPPSSCVSGWFTVTRPTTCRVTASN